MSALEFYLFGPPKIFLDGAEQKTGLHKSTALLLYLAVTKSPKNRISLATLLWPDVEQGKSLGYLRRAIYRVNRAIHAEALTATRHTVEFNCDLNAWLDIDVFQEYVAGYLDPWPASDEDRRSSAARLAQAVELYKDDFLAGFSLPDSVAFDDWQFFQTESLRQMLNRALIQLVEFHTAAQGWEQAIGFARRRVALNPLEESSQQSLIEVYAYSGQQAAAMRQYDKYRSLVEDELGISPGEELNELYERVRARQVCIPSNKAGHPKGSPLVSSLAFEAGRLPQHAGDQRKKNGHSQPLLLSPRAPDTPVLENGSLVQGINEPGPPHNLPQRFSPFIGRKKEVAAVLRLLDDVKCRLITVTGPGGIGKSGLVLEAASQARRSFPDGVYYVPLAALKTESQIVPKVAEEIGLSKYESGESSTLLLNYLRDKKLLLVLDNFDHLLPDRDFMAEILHLAPGVKFIVTSRERLQLSSETVFVLQGMDFPAQESVGDPLAYEAVQLLIQSARLAYPQMEIHAHDLQQAARICRLVQGMPLALILAAGWADVLTFEQIADEITESLDFLKSHRRDLPNRQVSVQAAFDYSWQRLSAEEQRAFMHIAVLENCFTREAAKQVAGAGLQILRSLVDKSLAMPKKNARFEIHEVIRQFAKKELEHSGRAEKALQAHCHYYLQWMGRRSADLKGGNQQAALAEIETDFQNIRKAWEYAAWHKDEPALDQAIESIFLFCDIRGRQKEGAELFALAREHLCSQPEIRPSLVYGRILIRLGMLQSRYLRDRPEISESIQDGLEIARRHDSRADIAFAFLALGHFNGDVLRDLVTAKEFFQHSLDLYATTGDDYFAARAIHLLGHCHLLITGIADFVPYGQKSLALARRIGDQAYIALLLVSLAMADFFLEDHVSAEHYAREGHRVASQVGHSPALAQANNFIGLFHLLNGEIDQAQPYLDAGLAGGREVSFPIPLIYALAAQGVQSVLLGHLQASLQYTQEGRTRPADPYADAIVAWASAVSAASVTDFTAARQYVHKVMDHHQRHGAPTLLALCLPVLAILLTHHGQPEYAVEMIALAQNHPWSFTGWMEQWRQFGDCRTTLEARLPEETYRAAWQRGEGKARDLNFDTAAYIAGLFSDLPIP